MAEEPTIKAIETQYKGYRMRSRLEARWAVFLDTLGVRWEYESEGYELGMLRYLPDFHIPAWEMFIEIKPNMSIRLVTRTNASSLSAASGQRVLVIAGNPWPGEYKGFLWGWDPQGFVTDGWEFGQCRRCTAPWLVSENYGAFALQICGCRGDRYPLAGSFADATVRAFAASRGARFEHRESG